MSTMTTKYCIACASTKPLTEFYRNKSKACGYETHCRVCKNKTRGSRSIRNCAQCHKPFRALKQTTDCCSRACSFLYVNRSMEANGCWKGGVHISSLGYAYIRMPDHPRATNNGYIKRANLVMEAFLDRPILKGEVVHHINEDRLDDSIENLQVMTLADHTRHHNPKKLRAPRPPRKTVAWPPHEELRRLVDATSLRDVAKQFGCCHQAVHKQLSRA